MTEIEEASDVLARENPALIEAWREYANAYLDVPAGDEAASLFTVGDELDIYESMSRCLLARGRYLSALVHAGIVRLDEAVPDNDTLWEMHPINLRAVLDD